jgi:hypothetical protein
MNKNDAFKLLIEYLVNNKLVYEWFEDYKNLCMEAYVSKDYMTFLVTENFKVYNPFGIFLYGGTKNTALWKEHAQRWDEYVKEFKKVRAHGFCGL